MRQEEEIKRTWIRKEVDQLSLYVDEMILYLKDHKNSTKKFLDIINSFSKLAGFKMNLQKSIDFLYFKQWTVWEMANREIIPFIVASKNT
jgi:hypothetical protein